MMIIVGGGVDDDDDILLFLHGLQVETVPITTIDIFAEERKLEVSVPLS